MSDSRHALAGQTVLVTGASGGIGRAIVQRLAAEGARPVIHYGRDRYGAQALLDEIGGNGFIVQADLSVPGGADSLWRQAVMLAGRIDGLVNNAGIMVAEDLAADDWLATAERTVTTNLLGPMRLTAALLPHLRRVKDAAIVTTSSGLAFVPKVQTPSYCATKAAVHSWSQTLRAQLATQGIEVIELAPPAVQTDLMPGHATDPNIMTLADYIDEVMKLFAEVPTPEEILVKRVMFLRAAEREGRYRAAFDAVNQPVK